MRSCLLRRLSLCLYPTDSDCRLQCGGSGIEAAKALCEFHINNFSAHSNKVIKI